MSAGITPFRLSATQTARVRERIADLPEDGFELQPCVDTWGTSGERNGVNARTSPLPLDGTTIGRAFNEREDLQYLDWQTKARALEVEIPSSVEKMVSMMQSLPGMSWRSEYAVEAYADEEGALHCFVTRGTFTGVAAPESVRTADGKTYMLVGVLGHTHPSFAGRATRWDRKNLAWCQKQWGQRYSVIAQKHAWSYFDPDRNYDSSATLGASPVSALLSDT